MFEKNVAALKERHPELVELVTQPISLDHITVTRAQNGDARLLIRTESGETFPLHNEKNPTEVASRSAEKVIKLGGVFVLMGLGLGYLAKALLERLGKDSALVIYEADPGIFKTALQETDLTSVLSHPRVKVLVGVEANIGFWAYYFMAKTGRQVRPIRFEAAFRLAPELYEKKLSHGLINPTLNHLSNWATAERFGSLVTKNCLESLHEVIRANGVQELQGIFSGVPAVLVAGGPSLGKNVQYLKQAKGRVVIIAADTILGYLLKCRITPDFVVTVDPQLATYRKFKGVNIPESCALVFHPTCQGQLPTHFPGPKFVTDTNIGIYAWLREFWPHKGSVEIDSQCQMHMGFNLAQWMGCDPIIMTGQDLCFTDALMHVKGGGYLSKHDEEQEVKKGPTVRDIFGNMFRTSQLYLLYKTTFEQKIEGFSGSVWQCTEGGVNMKGARILRLQDALESLHLESKLDVSKTLSALPAVDVSPNWEGLLLEIRSRVKDFFRLQRVGRHLSVIVEKMATERKKTQEVSPTLSRLTFQAERLTSLVPRYGKALSLLNLIEFDLELYINRFEAEEIDEIEDELERLDKQLERGRRYYRDMAKAATVLHQDLSSSLKRLETLKYLDELEKRELCQDELIHLIESFVSLEMYAEAQRWLMQLLDHSDLVALGERANWLSAYIPLQLHLLDLAYERVVVAKKHFPNSSELLALHEDVVHAREAWQQQVLERDHEVSNQVPFPFDPGDFYFKIGDYPQAITHYRLAAESNLSSNEIQGEAWFRVAKAAQASGDPTQSMEALEQALVLRPSDSRVYFELGVMALHENRLEIAEQFFEKGTEVSLENPVFCEAVGGVLYAAGFPNSAISFYERGLEQGSGNPDLLQKIAQAYRALFEGVPCA